MRSERNDEATEKMEKGRKEEEEKREESDGEEEAEEEEEGVEKKEEREGSTDISAGSGGCRPVRRAEEKQKKGITFWSTLKWQNPLNLGPLKKGIPFWSPLKRPLKRCTRPYRPLERAL